MSGPLACGGLLLPSGKDVLQEKVKVPGLAKEMGLVCRDAIDHDRTLVQLIGLAEQNVVVLHAIQAQQAKTARQSSCQQSVLVSSQPYSRFPVDQLLKLTEQSRRQRCTLMHCAQAATGSSIRRTLLTFRHSRVTTPGLLLRKLPYSHLRLHQPSLHADRVQVAGFR